VAAPFTGRRPHQVQGAIAGGGPAGSLSRSSPARPSATYIDGWNTRAAARSSGHAAALLEICNRVNTALGVNAMKPEGNPRAAAMLLRRGYDPSRGLPRRSYAAGVEADPVQNGNDADREQAS
jgi:hypothetical protein